MDAPLPRRKFSERFRKRLAAAMALVQLAVGTPSEQRLIGQELEIQMADTA